MVILLGWAPDPKCSLCFSFWWMVSEVLRLHCTMASTQGGVFYQLWRSTSHGGDLADLQGMKMIDFPSEATKRVTTIRILKVNMGDSAAEWVQSKPRYYTSLHAVRALWATYYRATQQCEQDTFRLAQSEVKIEHSQMKSSLDETVHFQNKVCDLQSNQIPQLG